MRSSSTCRSVFAALVVLMAGQFDTTAHAADPERALSQYIRDAWGNDRGFPGGPVHGIAQTADGYLWIAAEKGLVRFDGLTFKLFEPSAATSGTGPTVLGIAAHDDGSLWTRLRGPALLRYRNGKFESDHPSVAPSDRVITAMARGRDGAILMAPLGHGVTAYRDGRFTTIAPQPAMPGSFVIAITDMPDGDVWMGTRDSGLLRVQGERVTAITKGLPDQKINCLLAGAEGDLWIGTDNGVVRWNGREVTSAGLPAALARVRPLVMIKDRDANIWIGTASDGLLRVNADGVSSLEAGDPDARATISALFEDRDGNLWIGSPRGIERWRDGVFTTFSTAQGLPSDSPGPVYVDSAGRTWFGPSGGGLYWLRDGRAGRVSQGGLDEDVVYSIAGDGEGLWIGRQRGGLTRLRAIGGAAVPPAFTAQRLTQADGLAQNSVYAVYRARDGGVWAGTLSGGVSRYKDGAFTTYTATNGLASNTVTSILETADGAMWFGTPNGLSTLTRGGWRRHTVADGLPSNDVNTLFEDSTGSVWVGTAAGLAVLQAGQVESGLQAPAALRGSIVGIAEDDAGWLWIATADRTARVNRDQLRHGQVEDADVDDYGVADGLLGLEGVKRHRSVVRGATGGVWFSMNRGLSMADTIRAARPVLPALVHIESASADGDAFDLRGAVQIPPGRQRIALSYTGLSLSVPERVQFQYRLDGFDRDWSPPMVTRQAMYTNLGPGTYRFRVKASNSNGVWSDAEASIGFQIEPFVWQTAWFRVSMVLVGALAGWALYRLRMIQVARQLNVRFEARLAERTRIAQELHDTLLQGFISASMQLHVTADRLPDDSPARSSLSRVLDLMARVIEEGRNAVRGLRSTAGTSHDLETAFSGIPEELGHEARADYRVVVEGRPRPLNPMIRDEVYRIGREALVNAFRHSGAKRIEIELEYAASNLRILVRDDGCGIDAAVVRAGSDGHWGLPGMRERAERIGARFKVWSRASAGTEVELSVPGAIAFAPGAKRADS